MRYLIAILLLTTFSACSGQEKSKAVKLAPSSTKAIAAFAAGCFWCTEHIFEEIAGVDSAVSGYAGGKTKNPTYAQVVTETTGHAETILVYYNPKQVSYSELLDAFFASHDPTTLNRQGPDIGTSYRSAIFYSNAAEEEQIRKSIMKWQPAFKKAIVTEVSPLKAFYRAEESHQNYAASNPMDGYIRGVSMPRFEAFKRACKLKLKE